MGARKSVRTASANGQDFPFGVLDPVILVSYFHKWSRLSFRATTVHNSPYPTGSLLYPMKTKMQNIKKVYFCTKLFKNTIFIMYEWWRFQRYRICLKKSEIRICIEKFNFFFIHLVRSIQTKLKLDNKPKTRKQKIVGWALSIVVCAWNVRNKPKTRKQKIVGWALRIMVCARAEKNSIGNQSGPESQ